MKNLKSMKALLSLIFAFFCFLIFSFSSPTLANADQAVYLRVIDEKTILYSSPSQSSPLFFLPYTYYVKVIENLGEWTHVECFTQQGYVGIDGYVRSEKLFNDNTSPASPYLSMRVFSSSNCILYSDNSLTNGLYHVFKDRPLNFYGYYKTEDSNYLCLVEYNGKIGYVEEGFLFPFEIPLHPNELTFIPKDEPSSNPTISITPEQNETNNGIKITVFCTLALAGIIALIISIKPRKKPQKPEFYDENDYE